jgi:hypothetical protein
LKREDVMKMQFAVPFALVAGIGIGGAAVQTLHAQTKPKAYLVTESEILDAAVLAEYAPKARPTLRLPVAARASSPRMARLSA